MTARERIFDIIKEEMIDNIKNATLNNLSEIESLNNTLFGYAYYLDEVPNYTEPTEIHSQNQFIDENWLENDEDDAFDTEDINNKENVGTLKRNVAHGVIETQSGKSVFIPESIIRKNNYRHGDIIEFTLINKELDYETYKYKRIHKSENSKTERREFRNALVIRDNYDGSLCVEKSINDERLADAQDVFTTYTIPKQFITKYNIVENSLVDLAWMDNDVAKTIRVIWEH